MQRPAFRIQFTSVFSHEDKPLVRARAANDRVRPASDEAGEAGVRPPAQPQAGEQAVLAQAGSDVEKCVNCQFYDRRHARPLDGKAPLWGQCRRHSPRLNPVTAKTYVVEGVWPLVRDDDWCGEWKILTRTVEEWIPDAPPPVAVEEAPAIVSSRTSPAVPPLPVVPVAVSAAAAVGND